MNEKQQSIFSSQVSYSIDDDQESYAGALNAYDTAIEQRLTITEASEVSEAVFCELEKRNETNGDAR